MSVANIGRLEQRKRMVLGVTMLSAGAVIGVLAAFAGAGVWWRALALVPFWVGALGVLQARAKT